MGAARMRGLLVVSAMLLAISTTAAVADTYPPPVPPTEVVTEDVGPTTGVDSDNVVAPRDDTQVAPAVIEANPGEGTLSSTGTQVLPLLGAALLMVLVGGGLARLTRARSAAHE